MQADQSSHILQSMINFIKQHGEERVQDIEKNTKEQFGVEKEKRIDAEKKKIEENYSILLKKEEVSQKIARSKALNEERISRMTATNALVDKLLEAAKKSMHEDLRSNPGKYEQLLQDLLVQGLIRMIEPRVILKVRQEDLAIIKRVIAPAKKEYISAMIEHVEGLEDKETIPCEVLIDERNFLPAYNEDPDADSCLGGFEIYANNNRTVCSQTLDDRMALVFASATPAIRRNLFPSLRRK